MFTKILLVLWAVLLPTGAFAAFGGLEQEKIVCDSGNVRIAPQPLQVLCGKTTSGSHYTRMHKGNGSVFENATTKPFCVMGVFHNEIGYRAIFGTGLSDVGGTTNSTAVMPIGFQAAHDAIAGDNAGPSYYAPTGTTPWPRWQCAGYSVMKGYKIYAQIITSNGEACVMGYQSTKTTCHFDFDISP